MGRTWSLWFPLILIVILCGGALAYPPSRATLRTAWSIMQLPQELHDATFVTRVPRGAFFKISGFHFVPARSVSLTLPGRAPSGTYSVFAEQKSNGSSTLNVAEPMQWEVWLQHTRSADRVSLGTGYAPFVLDDTHVAWFAPDGIAVHGFVNGTTTLAYRMPIAQMGSAIQFSPDRRHVAWTDASKRVTHLGAVTAETYRETGTISDALASPVLANDALYDVRQSLRGAQLWRYPLSGGKAILIETFPPSFQLGSIAL